MISTRYLLASFAIAAGSVAAGEGLRSGDSTAAKIVRASGARPGLCVLLNGRDAALPAGLGQGGRYVVHAITADPAWLAKARGHVRSRGLYGRVSVATGSLTKLPYAGHLANLVVVDDLPAALAKGLLLPEVMRILTPRGVAMLGAGDLGADALKRKLAAAAVKPVEIVTAYGAWAKVVNPWPAAMDDWPGFDHGADGNPVSADTLVGPATSLRWRDAMWSRHTVSVFTGWVTAGGRMFHCVRRLMPDGHRVRYFLSARDAHNGLPLWERPVKWAIGAKYGDRNVIAAADRLYLPLEPTGPVVALDAATGKVLKTYAGTGRPDSMLVVGGKLFAATWRSCVAVDTETGKTLWKKDGIGGVMTWADGRLIMPNVYPRKLTSVDPATGEVRWQVDGGGTIPRAAALYHGGALVLIKNVKGRVPKYGIYLEGFSPTDGRKLWTFNPKQIWRKGGCYRGEVFGVGGLIWAHVDVDANPSARNAGPRPSAWVGLDPKTGEIRKRFDDATSDPAVAKMLANGIHRCNTGRATSRGYLFGTFEFFEWATGKYHVSAVSRSTCGIGAGMMPANGLVYIPPPTCVCRPFMQRGGFIGLAHRPGGVTPAARPPLQEGPAFGAKCSGVAGKGDWPAYRHDHTRGGATAAAVAADLKPLWAVDVGRGLTPPTVAAGMVFAAAGDEHRVVALDAAAGTVRWSFTAGGRVDSAPTFHHGRILFGCRDGWVYCLRSSDGKLIWRLRAAPRDELILVNGQLESAWPVHGSVLVLDGAAFAAAGWHSGLDGGVTLYALQPADGTILWSKHFEKLPDPAARRDFPVSLLSNNGKSVYMGRRGFDPKTGGKAAGSGGRFMRFGVSGFRDDNWAQYSNTKGRLQWTDGRAKGELLASGEKRTCGVSALRPRNYRGYGPQSGLGHYKLFGATEARKADWTVTVPLQMRAMVLAGATVFVAGRVDPDLSEIAKIADRKKQAGMLDALPAEKLLPHGAELWSFAAADGKKAGALKLDAPPVFDGMAAAGGRLYLSTQDGKLRSFGAR